MLNGLYSKINYAQNSTLFVRIADVKTHTHDMHTTTLFNKLVKFFLKRIWLGNQHDDIRTIKETQPHVLLEWYLNQHVL